MTYNMTHDFHLQPKPHSCVTYFTL